jgi:hypothetical protein
MAIYQGSALFLYGCYKQKWKTIYGNKQGLASFEKFKERLELGKELNFAGNIYTLNKK